MSTSQHDRRLHSVDGLTKLDTITAVLVPRQSRGEDGTMSVPDQIDAMREWCAKQTPPIVVGPTYPEHDVSGRRPLEKRKGLKRAVEDVESGRAQMILCAYFDRFVRSVRTRADVLVRVEEVGGVVMTLDFGLTSDATPVSKFTGTILAAVAEYVADQAGEKTMISKQRNIDRGAALPACHARIRQARGRHARRAPDAVRARA
jgi:DNA invertase Pin-like site-specific DNA recombinase